MPTTPKPLYERSPKDQRYDVIVAGGGPAGIGAALGAAITGASVLLLEARSQFGGTATAAMWMEINFLFKDNVETSRGGVHKLLIDGIRAWGPRASVDGRRTLDRPGSGGNLDVHPEYLKKVLFDLFDEHGVDYQLYSPVIDVVKEGNTTKGVVVQAKEGPVTYRGNVIIDCTGDGDVAWKAGCEMATQGDEVTGWRPPATVSWALANVDIDRLYAWLETGMELDRHQFDHLHDLIQTYRAQGYNLPGWLGVYKTTIPGVLSVNSGTSLDLSLDMSQSEARTLLEKMAIDQALDFIRLCQDKQIPGLEDCYLMRTGGYAMARDTRRLVGEYVFTDEDVMVGTEFEDVIATKYGGSDPVGEQREYTGIKQGAQWPYRALLPKTVDGLLVAGRPASATMLGHYGGKSMGNMISMGQGAGVAAALCAQMGVLPRDLNVRCVQAQLDAMGVSL